MWTSKTILAGLCTATAVIAADLSSCPGYTASNVQTTSNGMTADLALAGNACNVYGNDLDSLTLTVEYQTDDRLHVIIQDTAQQVYQVPTEVLPRPASSDGGQASTSNLEFKYETNPFSFSIHRKDSNSTLFDSSAASLIFEDQYIRLRTSLPPSPSLYGLGEHTDPFMLNTTNYTRTIWNRDAYGVPPGTNLYGDHPIYFDHRNGDGTHAVFLLNSNGMDVKINQTGGEQWLEYNLLGGVLDFYFLAGPEPASVARQYADVVGHSALFPYWGLGFHQCRYGMQDVYEVAGVVHNYSVANIPLETMWTDIDYMYLRRVFTLDPERFPLDKVRQLVDYLHEHQQHYIVMVDPAVAYQTENYLPFSNGVAADAFLKVANGSIYAGVVWPGAAEFPDWFAPGTQGYWDGEFARFFSADSGVDIDALWIDMNEASNFCDWPCKNPFLEATKLGDPPRPPPIRIGSPIELPGFPADFQPMCHTQVTFSVKAKTFLGENIAVYGDVVTIGSTDIWNAVELNADNYPVWTGTVDMPANMQISYQYIRVEPDGTYVYEDQNRTLTTGACGSSQTVNDTITTNSPPQGSSSDKRDLMLGSKLVPMVRRQSSTSGSMMGLPNRNLIDPPYMIQNAAGSLSNKTIDTNIVHSNGLVEYDTHNLYGAMMSEASRSAMASRRPGLRPLVITRSTFAGSGRQVGHWLGDNFADWDHYRFSIAGLLAFGSLFQVPMVGSDVCGFGGVTNELLCARWATLGAFSPFYRNHQTLGVPPHEFYRWDMVAEAARNAIEVRYKLLDYIYTAMYDQNVTGMPLVQPMFFAYPDDANCNELEYQYFWGPGLLVAPVTADNSTTASIYLPNDIFYDYHTHETIQGNGSVIHKHVPYTSIALYYKGGQIFAQRAQSANTTTELRNQNFQIVIAPGTDGTAKGSLYLDDGVSIEQPATSYIQFSYSKDGKFTTSGSFGYQTNVNIESVVVLGGGAGASSYAQSGEGMAASRKVEKTLSLMEPVSVTV